jgi:hypothetical protein
LNEVLILIEAMLPAAEGNAALIEKIIAALVAAQPMISAEYADLKPIVANVIAAVRSDPSTTAAQLDVLDKMETALDAAYETAAAAAAAQDAAAPST